MCAANGPISGLVQAAADAFAARELNGFAGAKLRAERDSVFAILTDGS